MTSNFGKRSGSVSTNRFEEDSLRRAIKRSEDIAKLSPENMEFMEPLGQQKYLNSRNYSRNTANVSSDRRSLYVSEMINKAEESNVIAAGYYEDEVGFTSIMNSKGLFAYNLRTNAGFSSTFRTKDGTGSSRVNKSYVNVNDLDTLSLSERAIKRSLLSANPAELKPGRYTVILEPAAVADMLGLCLNFMGARQADEGRSYFSKPGGGNRKGELLVDPRVNIYSNPVSPFAPSIPFTSEGLPREKTAWFSGGVLKNLFMPRFWASKAGQPAIPFPSNLIMQGSGKSLDEMIAETDSGILVSRFWYIRTVDPQTMLLTGLTRDGLFEIKDGNILRPLKNFRFNESPMNILKNIVDIGQQEKAAGSEIDWLQVSVPSLKVDNFNFSSLSEAI